MRQPLAQRPRAHVDELDLVGAADDRVGNGLVLGNPDNVLDDVGEALQGYMSTVVSTLIPACRIASTSCQRLAWRLRGALV